MHNIIYTVISIEMYILFHNSVHDHLLLGSDNSNTNDSNNSNSNGSPDVPGINYAYQITKNHKKHTII